MSKSDLFVEMFDSGKTISEISKETGSHYSFIYGVIERKRPDRIKKNTDSGNSKADEFRKMFDSGMTIGEIAKTTNSNYSYVFAVVDKHRKSTVKE